MMTRGWAAITAAGWIGIVALAMAGCDSGNGQCVRNDGTVLEAGQTVTAADGCNTCVCQDDGIVSCTARACVTTCEQDGTTYSPGASFPDADGCNTCTCESDGTISCTELACPVTCEYDGATHEPGDSFPATDGCNTCTCGQDGMVLCTLTTCPEPCSYDGMAYQIGATFPATDGCNTCTCEFDGVGSSVSCTEIACGVTCTYEGATYDAGDTFPADDGCNTCTCGDDGVVGCTKLACPGCMRGDQLIPVGETVPAGDGCNTCTCNADGEAPNCTRIACQCDPALDWWRDYVSTSPEACQLVDLACDAPLTAFSNVCGCGCQQDRDCPRSIDCSASGAEAAPPEPACDPVALEEMCPLSSTLGDGCTANHPCGPSEGTCYRPGQPIGCGICLDPPAEDVCVSDGDCDAGEICEARATDCTCNGDKLCHPGCTADTDCALGEVCGDDGHCEGRTCTDASECPVDFRCDAGGCLRKSCSSDAQCDGWCVEGQCYGTPGFCGFPPP